jgi:hypothetical protein
LGVGMRGLSNRNRRIIMVGIHSASVMQVGWPSLFEPTG